MAPPKPSSCWPASWSTEAWMMLPPAPSTLAAVLSQCTRTSSSSLRSMEASMISVSTAPCLEAAAIASGPYETAPPVDIRFSPSSIACTC